MDHIFYLGWLGGALTVAGLWVLHPVLLDIYHRRRSAYRRHRVRPIVRPPSVADEAQRWLNGRA